MVALILTRVLVGGSGTSMGTSMQSRSYRRNFVTCFAQADAHTDSKVTCYRRIAV
jgi:hypothetical protein